MRESVSITEREAVKLKVVDFVADDVADLLRKVERPRRSSVQGAHDRARRRPAPTSCTLEMRIAPAVLDVLADPNIAYLLMMAGLLGLYVEFTNPGVFFPGVAGAICLLLALAAMQVLPINYTGLGLIGLGVAHAGRRGCSCRASASLGVGGWWPSCSARCCSSIRRTRPSRVDRGLIAGAAADAGRLHAPRRLAGGAHAAQPRRRSAPREWSARSARCGASLEPATAA